MFLYVEMFDGITAFSINKVGCSCPSGCRRIVRLELTSEQIKQIKPRPCGQDDETNEMFFESVNPLSIQDS